MGQMGYVPINANNNKQKILESNFESSMSLFLFFILVLKAALLLLDCVSKIVSPVAILSLLATIELLFLLETIDNYLL